MRTAAVLLVLLLWQVNFDRRTDVDADATRFRVQRALIVDAGKQGQACTVLDAAVYAHTEGRLNAMRVYRVAGQGIAGEVPFALTESGEAGQQEEAAHVLNLGMRGKEIVFDLAMPQRTYTTVVLGLSGRDFYAEAHVTGTDGKGVTTDLGRFALFDLESQGLSRSTTLPLQEVSFPMLHVELTVKPAPGNVAGFHADMVTGAQVPPSREAQTLYTTVVSTSVFETKAVPGRGSQTIAKLRAPAHVPVERFHFTVEEGFKKNFSRDVMVEAMAVHPAPKKRDLLTPRVAERSEPDETFAGELQRVQLPAVAFAEPIRIEHTTLDTVLGSNMREDADVRVVVENRDDSPLPIKSLELSMRQRKLCFEAEAGATYVLRYGDAEPVRAPVYEYARLFQASAVAASVAMGEETANPSTPVAAGAPAPTTGYTQRHPEVLWVVLLAVICALGMVAVRSARRAGGR